MIVNGELWEETVKELRKVKLEERSDFRNQRSKLTAGKYTFLEKTFWHWGDFLPVFYREGTVRDTTLALLLVSRQIHAETKGILHRKIRKMGHSSWEADVMFIGTPWRTQARLSHKSAVT